MQEYINYIPPLKNDDDRSMAKSLFIEVNTNLSQYCQRIK